MYQKKSWTNEEDQIIRKYVEKMGDRPRWKSIAEKLNQAFSNQEPLNRRTPKQCRQRWHNKLDPQIMDRQWDQDQINKLFQLHNEHGNKWSLIATMMNGRTDNCVKNKFYSALRKGMRKINKYIVNLKRKLTINKNICIKQFKDVVLTKLIAVADKKYKDKLDVKENSQSKTQKLSEAIKLALVKISYNEDDYVGHVKNGVPDGQYLLEQTLFKNIQEFCRNCKRKKGKKKDSDEEQQAASEFIQESQLASQNHSVQDSKLLKLSKSIKIKKQSKSKSDSQKIDQIDWEKNKVPSKNKFQDLLEGINSSPQKNSPKKSPFFTSFIKNQDRTENWLKLSTQQNDFMIEGLKQKRPSQIDDTDFLKSIRDIVEPNVEYQKTDNHNHSKSPSEVFKIQEIFFQCPNNILQNSNNTISLSSSNNFFSAGERSGSLSLLGLSRPLQNPFDLNPAAVYMSSSYSSSSNKQQQKLVEILHSLQKQKKEEKVSMQRSSQNFPIASSYQYQQLFRRASQRH